MSTNFTFGQIIWNLQNLLTHKIAAYFSLGLLRYQSGSPNSIRMVVNSSRLIINVLKNPSISIDTVFPMLKKKKITQSRIMYSLLNSSPWPEEPNALIGHP